MALLTHGVFPSACCIVHWLECHFAAMRSGRQSIEARVNNVNRPSKSSQLHFRVLKTQVLKFEPVNGDEPSKDVGDRRNPSV